MRDITSDRRPAVDDVFLSNRVLDYTASASGDIQDASSKLVCHLLRHELDPGLSFRAVLDHVAQGDACSECENLLQRLVDLLREGHALAERIHGPQDPPPDTQPDGWKRVPRTTTLRGPISAAGPTTGGSGTAGPTPQPNNPPSDGSGDETGLPVSSATAQRLTKELADRAPVSKSRANSRGRGPP